MRAVTPHMDAEGTPAFTPDATKNAVLKVLDEILHDFGVERTARGSKINFTGDIPPLSETKSKDINMTLIGAVPALANAVLATQICEARGGEPQTINIDLRRSHNYLDPGTGMTPTINGQDIPLDMVAGNPFLFSIYKTADGRHAVPSAVQYRISRGSDQNIALSRSAHRQPSPSSSTTHLTSHPDLESAAARAGLPFALIHSPTTWSQTPQGSHLTTHPIVPINKSHSSTALILPPNPSRPLSGLKVLCLTHAIAGPSSGRTLAEHGASVLQVIYTHGFEHPFVYTYANLGTASTRLDLGKESDRRRMWELVAQADVWVDSYRDGALEKFGFTNAALFEQNPGLIVSKVRLYGTSGPWRDRAGFDMQGSASSGLMVVCGEGEDRPAWPPGQVINDYTTGYFGALAIQVVVLRRLREWGGWVVSPSLAGTAMSIVKYFKSERFEDLKKGGGEVLPPKQAEYQTGLGLLRTLRPLPKLSLTPLEYSPVVLEAMGSSLPVFPGSEDNYDIDKVDTVKKEQVIRKMISHGQERVKRLTEIAKQKSPAL